MQYVPFGDLGFNISRLGFGMMRLPKVTLPDGSTALDEARATAMLRSAIDQGLSYVDTAYPYCDGQGEPLVGRILKDGYRERVKLATKLPVWKVETRQDMDAVLDEQLKRLDVPYVDFYLLHALGRERWEKMKALGVREFLDSAVKDGRIRYPAFSFHDDYEVFRDILTSYDWRMAQIQFNYLDIRHQAGLRGIRLARARRVPLVVMEPLRGGALANPPAEVRAMMERYPVQCSPVEWAFRYVGDFDQVAVMLSGMSDEAQVQDNLRIFENVRPGCLSDADKRLIARLRTGYRKRMPIGCTGCAYCVPCPRGVGIPRVFAAYNEAAMFDRMADFPRRYQSFVENEQDAGHCVRCGLCEGKCPQHLPIRDWLQTVHTAGQKSE